MVVVANLKPRNMAGVPSAGMLLCANDGGEGDARTVQSLLRAPEGAVPGERLTWGDHPNAAPARREQSRQEETLGKDATRLGRQRQERGDVERDSAHLVRWAGDVRRSRGGGIS